MAKYLRSGQDFDFPESFGFHGSAKGPKEARNRPPADQTDDGTYVAKQARGGRIHKAAGGDIEQTQLSAPHQTFGQAFAAARRTALAGGPKNFEWNGKTYNTNTAPEAPAHRNPQMPPSQPQAGRRYEAQDATYEAPAAPLPSRAAAAPAPSSPYRGYEGEQAAAPVRPANPYSLLTPEEEDAEMAGQQARAHGGRIHRAIGGPAIPGGMPGQGAPSPMGAMPTGSPGVAAQNPAQTMHGALSNATITMPVGDAARAAAGAMQLGHQIGHAQAMRGAAPRVARPPMPQQPPAMAEGGKFRPGGEKGKLHREMNIPEGQKIPAARLEAAAHSSDPEKRRDAIRAQTMKKWHKGG